MLNIVRYDVHGTLPSMQISQVVRRWRDHVSRPLAVLLWAVARFQALQHGRGLRAGRARLDSEVANEDALRFGW
jgi:hypothetical protein